MLFSFLFFFPKRAATVVGRRQFALMVFLVLHDWLTHTSTHPAPQVATRFLSVCPALYWGVVSEGRLLGPEVQRWICIYSITFGLLGALMFPTFYPWT